MAAVCGICIRVNRNFLGPRVLQKHIFETVRYNSKTTNSVLTFSQLNKFCRFSSARLCGINLRNSNSSIRLFSHSPLDAKVNPINDDKDKEDEEELKKKRDANWRTMKYSLIAMGSMFGVFGSYLIYSLGSPPTDENGNIIEDDFSTLPMPTQYFKRMLRELDYYNKMIQRPSREKLLPDPLKPPLMQPKYTLILEMNDLLVHPEWTYQTGWRFKKRPGVDKFLEAVSMELFEIVVFTAEQGMTVFPILDALDPNGYIMYRLVRDSTDFVDGHHVKNLNCINRDLSKVIVVDWNQNSVKFHPQNALLIPRWKGNDDDATLVDLAVFLRTIASSDIDDVRDVLTYYSQFDNPIEAFRENQRKLLEQMEENQEREKKKASSLTSKWTNTFLKKSSPLA